LSKPTVLLADDHPKLLEKVENLLKKNFEVVGRVGDGQALIEAAIKLEPDVIVTDISMPIFNGIEAVKRLKESGCQSKVVFLTIHADPDYVRVSTSLSALGYVVKPRMGTDLIPAIQEALTGRIFISPSLHYLNCA